MSGSEPVLETRHCAHCGKPFTCRAKSARKYCVGGHCRRNAWARHEAQAGQRLRYAAWHQQASSDLEHAQKEVEQKVWESLQSKQETELNAQIAALEARLSGEPAQ